MRLPSSRATVVERVRVPRVCTGDCSSRRDAPQQTGRGGKAGSRHSVSDVRACGKVKAGSFAARWSVPERQRRVESSRTETESVGCGTASSGWSKVVSRHRAWRMGTLLGDVRQYGRKLLRNNRLPNEKLVVGFKWFISWMVLRRSFLTQRSPLAFFDAIHARSGVRALRHPASPPSMPDGHGPDRGNVLA